MQSVLQNLPVGWRFQPTNEELLDYYLKNKRLGLPIPGFDVEDIQIYDFDPSELIDKNSPSKERYLFCRRQFHQKTGGIQRKRKAKAGSWKRTGKIQYITREDSDEVIGTKTIFVYRDPKPTDYVKHEYELTKVLDSAVQDDFDFVLCKLMISKKPKASKKPKIVNSKKKGAINSKQIEVHFRNKEERISKKSRKGLSDRDAASVSVSDNRKQYYLVTNSPYGEGEPSNHTTSDFEYQNQSNRCACSAFFGGEQIKHLTQTPIAMTAKTWEEGESSHRGAYGFEYQKRNEIINTSIYDKDSTSFLMNSDYVKNSKEISRNSMSETCSQSTPTLENHYPNDSTTILHGRNFTLFENQNLNEIAIVSPSKTVGTSCSACIKQYNTTLYSDYNNQNEMGYPLAFDFENQNPSRETNISASLERSGSLLLETTVDFGKQTQCEKTDISDLCDLGEDTFLEIMLDGLTVYDDLLDTLSSEPT